MTRVLVAMSGGVDSSVAAARLVAEGHDVVGVTLKLWGGESDSGCCSVSDVDDARRVAQQLDIDHHVFNFADGFTRDVVDAYVAEHAAGRTPNPCIECNRHIKFDLLLRRAAVLGFDTVATGHHARVVTGPDGRPHLARGADAAKDQSYVLYVVGSDDLARVVLPVGSLTKDEVRAEADRLGLRTAAKPDSQDVCFITARDGRGAFLGQRTALESGTVVDTEGAVVGSVPAVQLVTIGQRKGLGLSGGPARYVTGIDHRSRTVTVGPAEALLRDSERVSRVVWATEARLGPALVQVSAHGEAWPAVLEPCGDGVAVRWVEPRRAVAPGQSAVFYHDDMVIGGGIVVG
jgi:tRNA-uridine 2-sulfurtransferase